MTVQIWCSITIICLCGCGERDKEREAADLHQRILGVEIPREAENITVNRPGAFGRFTNDYMILEFTLSPAESSNLLNSLPDNYSKAEPLKEVYVGGRLFSDRQMPKASIAQRDDGHVFTAVVTDPASNKVYSLYFSR